MATREEWRRIQRHGGYDDGKGYERRRFARRRLKRGRFKGRKRLEGWQRTGGLALHDGQSVRRRTRQRAIEEVGGGSARQRFRRAKRHGWAPDAFPSPAGCGTDAQFARRRPAGDGRSGQRSRRVDMGLPPVPLGPAADHVPARQFGVLSARRRNFSAVSSGIPGLLVDGLLAKRRGHFTIGCATVFPIPRCSGRGV